MIRAGFGHSEAARADGFAAASQAPERGGRRVACQQGCAMTFDGEKWAKHHAWDIPSRSWREQIHHNIQHSNGAYAENVVAELMKSLPCREFDGVLTENFETAVSDAAAFITECTQVAGKGCGATALSLDLECGLGNPYEWSCVAYAYTDSPFLFSQASLVELKASVDKGSWRGCFESFETDGAFNQVQLKGLASYRYVSHDSSQSSDYSRPIALALSEVMLGLKYKRFIGEAIAIARDAAPMWIITQGHDSFWMPTCFFAGGHV
jgi:hypothetical protein